MVIFSSVILAALFGSLLAHGVVTDPSPRVVGGANLAACGAAVYKVLKSGKALLLCVENAAAKIDSDYNATACYLFFCRGYQYEDNVDSTRVYATGQVVPFAVDIEAHHTGYANVSVVNLATQTPIARLFTWDVYANDSLGPSQWPKNESSFNVTIPDLGDTCTTASACAIQWWWYATKNVQTFESCVDFATA
ncbi:uncharacterized protein BT62DRAFT_906694 [Guyanagaster necrorhizus]|uniref:Chitin-binding type-4 domain-containing protein n=1 Tax=Guyanagaster necrorhizus TaxID=856835 RepID=A0A9P8APS0_9AGAR|nr:uncharacterized protein BT62DRAFT_906694 [Guyanagaster necrorhizus MCA 3950]KAG7442147.1 hypothetical protein BT62DRAFT_906694 [Guyanagaster necrorhizus MCA 3950]